MAAGEQLKPAMPRAALVTGANRGIGLATVRLLAAAGYEVILAARRQRDAEDAARKLAAAGLHARPIEIDVAREASVNAAARGLTAAGVGVDLLVNNAGIFPQGDILTGAADDFTKAMAVNALGPLWCARAFMPGMIARGYGRIVNLTSGYGSIGAGLGGPAAYALSKATLNAVTVKLAQAAQGDVKVNAVDPGWVRTRMGGPSAPTEVEAAAADVLWAATLPADGPHGVLLRHRRVVPW